jgi:hypothetical protein
MTTLTREALAASAEPTLFDVSAGGMAGKARKLKHSQLTEYESWMTDKQGSIDRDRWLMHRERLLGMCLVNDDGSLMFPGDEWKLIGDLDAAIVKELYQQVEAGCGFAAIAETKTVKNSEAD